MMASPQEEGILQKNYKFLSSLGRGAFGEVVLAQHLPTKTKVAIKVLEKEYNEEEYINSEVAIHKSLHHRNIIQLFHSFSTLRTTYLIMEYLEGKNLVTLINEVGCLTEEEVRPIFNQLASAVHFLHQRLIAHRDIKLENILLGQGGIVKLCDFGLATQLVEGQMLEELWGSLPYMAPEILAGTPYDALAGDMWSLGIVFYALVTGHLPYVESTPEAMYHLITTTPCRIPYHLSRPCLVMLAMLLTRYIRLRLTSSHLVERPWLGHIQEHVTPPAKEILPKVAETMCNIGYTCEQVVSSLKDPQSNLTDTINILKFKVSSGDSSLQHIIPAVATRVPVALKRSHSQPALLSRGESTHTHLLHTHTCPEALHYPDNTAPKGDALATETINPATGDTTVTMMSLESLADTAPEGDTLAPETINPATGDTTVTMMSLESLADTAPEGDALAPETINPATGDTTVTMMSLESLADTAPEGDALAPETINPVTGDTTVTMMSLESLADTAPEGDALAPETINPVTGDTTVTMMSLESLADTAPEGDALAPETINPATGDTTVTMMSLESLADTAPEGDTLAPETINPATGDTTVTMMSLESLADTAPEGDALAPETINPATGDTTVTMMSLESLADTAPEGDALAPETINPVTGDTTVTMMTLESLADTAPEGDALAPETINPATGDTTVTMMSLESLADTAPEGDALAPETINPATGDITVTMMSLESLADTAPEGDTLATETINPATGDTTVTMMSLESLADESSSPDPPLNDNCVGLVSMAVTKEEESREPEVPSDQPQLVPTASGTRPLRGWKLMKKRISRALRALCCCCLPTPPGQTEVA